METSDKQEKILTELLKEMPDVEPSSTILESVMSQIKPKKQSLWRQIRTFFEAQTMFLRLSALAASLFLAFWVGTKYTTPVVLTASNSVQQSDLAEEIGAVDNPQANFLVGRGLLESGKNQKALAYLLKAVDSAPENSTYALWAGVGAAAVGDYSNERRLYKQAISSEPDNLQANLYLGHNYASTGRFSDAIRYYDRVLAVDPTQPVALYNKALVLGATGADKQLEKGAWETYLNYHRNGKWAYQALDHLNTLGGFSYRAHQIGSRKIILNSDELWRLNRESTLADVTGLEEIVQIVNSQPESFELHVVAYAENAPLLAKQKALVIQKMFRDELPSERHRQIRASWFGLPETISSGDKTYSKEMSILLIGYSKKRVEVSI